MNRGKPQPGDTFQVRVHPGPDERFAGDMVLRSTATTFVLDI